MKSILLSLIVMVLVVLIIIGILAGYIGPKIMGRPEEARRTLGSGTLREHVRERAAGLFDVEVRVQMQTKKLGLWTERSADWEREKAEAEALEEGILEGAVGRILSGELLEDAVGDAGVRRERRCGLACSRLRAWSRSGRRSDRSRRRR